MDIVSPSLLGWFASYVNRFFPNCDLDQAQKEAYEAEQTELTLRVSRIAIIIAMIGLPLYALQDQYILKLHVFQWRLFAFIVCALFGIGSFTVFKKRRRLIVPCYALCLFSVMMMMAGIFVAVHRSQGSSDFQRFLVINSIITAIVIVFFFSAGSRRYLIPILFLPFAYAMVSLIIQNRSDLDMEFFSALSNPAGVVVAVLAMSAIQERLSIQEFVIRKTAADRGTIIEEKNAQLAAVNAELSSTLRQVEQDYEEKKRAEELIRQEQQTLQTFLDAITEPAYLLDTEGRLLSANQALAAYLGKDLQSMLGEKAESVFAMDFSPYEKLVEEKVIDAQEPLTIQFQKGQRVFEDTVYPVKESEGTIHLMAVLREDVTERVTSERQLRYDVDHDALTGLDNRRSFLSNLETAVSKVSAGERVTLLYADLDGFKEINDRHGHEAGDQVLQSVAKLLLSSLRNEDLAARLGGDEFAIILMDRTAEEGVRIGERLVRKVAELRFEFENQAVGLGLSVGVSQLDGKTEAAVELRRADETMYHAKKTGKSRVVRY